MQPDGTLRTNAFLKLHPPQDRNWAGKLTFSLGYPVNGWIQLAVTCTAYVQGLIVSVSAVADPFPEMFHWLEAIAAGNLPSEFTIDEEGHGKTFRATPVNDEEFLLTVAPMFWRPQAGRTEEPLFLYVVASKRQVIAEFLKRWDDFIATQWDADEWTRDDLSSHDLSALDVSTLREFVEREG